MRSKRHISHGLLIVTAGIMIGSLGLYLTFRTNAAVVTPRKTADFLNSMGIIVHPSQSDYYNMNDVVGKITSLKIKHVRNNTTAEPAEEGYANGLQLTKALAGAGLKLHFTVKAEHEGDTPPPAPSIAEVEADIDSRINFINSNGLAGATESIEPYNEFDNRGYENWDDLLKHQIIYLHSQRSRLPASLKITGPALLGFKLPRNAPLMTRDDNGNLMNTYFDYGNVHSYYTGKAPESGFRAMLPQAVPSQFNVNPGNITTAESFETRMKANSYYISKNKPVVITETGYTNTKDNFKGKIDEAGSGTYIPRAFIDTFRIGVQRTYLYELLDEPQTRIERERNFGLYRRDGSPKPAATAIKNMNTLLSGGTASFTPAPLSYSATGSLPISTFLMQKKPGEYWLALWRPVSVYDLDTDQPISQPSSNTTVTFDSLKQVQYYRDLSLTKDPGVPVTANKSFTVSVGPKVSLLKITNQP